MGLVTGYWPLVTGYWLLLPVPDSPARGAFHLFENGISNRLGQNTLFHQTACIMREVERRKQGAAANAELFLSHGKNFPGSRSWSSLM